MSDHASYRNSQKLARHHSHGTSSFGVKRVCIAALSVGLAACGSESNGDPWPPYRFELERSRTVLDNGLEVLILPNHAAPAVVGMATVRAGAFVETEAQSGYSHLFEHMIFQGSRAVPDSVEFRTRLDRLGAEYNALTDIDRVAYYFTTTPASLAESLSLFAGALREPELDPEALEKEKQVVIGEFDLDESNPDFVLNREAQRALYGALAGRINPLGERETVLSATPESLRTLHARYYVPGNTLLTLAGDIDPAGGLELARAAFADWQPGPDPFAEAPPVPEAPATPTALVLQAGVEASRLFAYWHLGDAVAEGRTTTLADALVRLTQQRDNRFRRLNEPGYTFIAALQRAGGARTTSLVATLELDLGNERNALERLQQVTSTLGRSGTINDADLRRAQGDAFTDVLYQGIEPLALSQAVSSAWATRSSEAYFAESGAAYDVTLAELDTWAGARVRRKPDALVLLTTPDTVATEGLSEEWLSGGTW
jgi:zinc protease